MELLDIILAQQRELAAAIGAAQHAQAATRCQVDRVRAFENGSVFLAEEQRVAPLDASEGRVESFSDRAAAAEGAPDTALTLLKEWHSLLDLIQGRPSPPSKCTAVAPQTAAGADTNSGGDERRFDPCARLRENFRHLRTVFAESIRKEEGENKASSEKRGERQSSLVAHLDVESLREMSSSAVPSDEVSATRTQPPASAHIEAFVDDHEEKPDAACNPCTPPRSQTLEHAKTRRRRALGNQVTPGRPSMLPLVPPQSLPAIHPSSVDGKYNDYFSESVDGDTFPSQPFEPPNSNIAPRKVSCDPVESLPPMSMLRKEPQPLATSSSHPPTIRLPEKRSPTSPFESQDSPRDQPDLKATPQKKSTTPLPVSTAHVLVRRPSTTSTKSTSGGEVPSAKTFPLQKPSTRAQHVERAADPRASTRHGKFVPEATRGSAEARFLRMVQLGRNDEAKAIYAAFISRHSGEVRVVAVGGEFTECQSPLDARVPDGKKRTNNPASLMHRRPFDFNCVIPSGRDAVHICSRNGNLEMLQWMYAKRQDILLRDQGGNESESAKHAVLPQLHESAPNFELVGGGGDTAVNLAAWNGHVSVLQFLCNVVGLDAFQRIGMARSRRDKESDQGRLRRIITDDARPAFACDGGVDSSDESDAVEGGDSKRQSQRPEDTHPDQNSEKQRKSPHFGCTVAHVAARRGELGVLRWLHGEFGDARVEPPFLPAALRRKMRAVARSKRSSDDAGAAAEAAEVKREQAAVLARSILWSPDDTGKAPYDHVPLRTARGRQIRRFLRSALPASGGGGWGLARYSGDQDADGDCDSNEEAKTMPMLVGMASGLTMESIDHTHTLR